MNRFSSASYREEKGRMIATDNKADKKSKILIMDDDDFILDILTEMLDLLGHTAVAATEGDEALRIIESSYKKGEIFAACILDLAIPGGKGGLDIVKEIRSISEKTEIIALSGYTENPVIEFPEKYGFSGSLRKPFKLDEFSEIIRRYV